jgi:thioredoxin-like negative regulator of GroEL
MLVQASEAAGAHRFTSRTAMEWLKVYPGDLEANLMLSKALYADGEPEQALDNLKALCTQDPEFIAAWQLAAALFPDGSQE